MKFNFSHFTPHVKLFFVDKIFGTGNAMQRGIRKILTFIKL